MVSVELSRPQVINEEKRTSQFLAEIKQFAYFIERMQSSGLEVTSYDGETLAKFASEAKVFKMVSFNRFNMVLENLNSRIFLNLQKVYKKDIAGKYPEVNLKIGIASRYNDLSKLTIDSCNVIFVMNGVEFMSVPPLVVAPKMSFHDSFDNLIEVDLKEGIYTRIFPR